MKLPSATARISMVLVPLLIVLHAISYLLFRYAASDIAEQSLHRDLQVGENLFKHLLEQQNEQMQQRAELLAMDFGFRDAVSTQHRDTIDSVLLNHAERTNAGLVALTALDGTVLGRARVRRVIQPREQTRAVSDAVVAEHMAKVQAGVPRLSPSNVAPDKLFAWVKTAVRAPRPMGYLTFGFPVDDSFAATLRNTTDLEFAFFSQQAGGAWVLHASSFDIGARLALLDDMNAAVDSYHAATLGGKPFKVLTVEIGSDGDARVVALIGRPTSTVVAPLNRLENVVGVLILVTALVWLLGLLRVARRVVAPLDNAAYRDNLTAIANRRLFEANVRLAEQNLRSLGHGFVVAVMDLNKFKGINDSLGHGAGDEVLQIVARRLLRAVRQTDTVARLGGDEFGLLMLHGDRAKAAEIAENIRDSICRPMALRASPDRAHCVGISMGIAMAPSDGSTLEALVACADRAMYLAKRRDSGFAFCGDEATLLEEQTASPHGAGSPHPPAVAEAAVTEPAC